MALPGRLPSSDTRGVVVDHEFTERTTFVVTPDMKVGDAPSADDKINPAQHVEQSLAIVQQLAKAKRCLTCSALVPARDTRHRVQER